MIAALFPGQNSHALGMGVEFADAFFVARAVFDTAEQVVPSLTSLMREGPLETLTLTANQQPALVAASIPLALKDSLEHLKDGDVGVLVGFGGGLAWSAVALRWKML